jgi:hypothetical protein
MDWAEHPWLAVTNLIISCFNLSNLAFFWVPMPPLLCFISRQNQVNPYQRYGGNPNQISQSKFTGCSVFQLAVASFFAFPSAIIGLIV